VWEISMSGERKVAVITSASRGIGAVLVRGYRDRNYRVVATARSIGALDVVPGDNTDRKTAEHVIQQGVSQFGRIDALVNNTGIFIAKPFTSYTEADYPAIMGVNVAGFFHMSQRAAARMEKQGRGHIVQVTTSLVDHAIAGALGSLTKGSLNATTKSLAIEFARRNICVNADLAIWRV
jgi:NAD(P)-dependent dehydrogenase (short-subunit alcohol dehydrogenase family)